MYSKCSGAVKASELCPSKGRFSEVQLGGPNRLKEENLSTSWQTPKKLNPEPTHGPFSGLMMTMDRPRSKKHGRISRHNVTQ